MSLETLLSYGWQRLPDNGLRLQLLVFNGAVAMSLVLALGMNLILLLFGLHELMPSSLSMLLLFSLIPLVARLRYFLLARILYVLLCQAGVAYGVLLHGTSSPFVIFCLDLALLPLLLFRSRECRWAIASMSLSLLLFLLIEFKAMPLGIRPLPQEVQVYVTVFQSIGAFAGVIGPSFLVFWQTHAGFRQALRLHRLQAHDENFAAIGRLAAGAAHEINNPLAIVQLTLENLEKSLGVLKEPDVQVRMQHGYDAIRRIHSILQKLLSSSLMPFGQLEAWPIQDMAARIEQRFRSILEEQGVQLNVCNSLPPGFCLHCHRQGLLNVMDSLIHNALEALAGQSRPQVLLSLGCESSSLCIKVEDNGPGVSKKELQTIFMPFFTTKDIGRGLGLGLYSARCIVQQYGGDLTCEGGPGGRFILSLPLERETATRQA